MAIEVSTTYKDLNIIGRGAYGTVYMARNSKNNSIVALKKVRVPLTEEGIPMNTLREIALLKQLDMHEHPNIVRLLDICHGQRLEKELIMFLVFEHVDQDLASFIDKFDAAKGIIISNDKIRNISREILCGVDFLHTQRIVHRDLKPQNILVTHDCHIKLADFGLAKSYDFEMRLTSVVVTLWYRSPEVLLGQPYATPVDVWSVGCVIAELFMLKPLFCGTSEGDQLCKIFQILGKPEEHEWPEQNVPIKYNSFDISNQTEIASLIPDLTETSYDLIMKMLLFNPYNRISAEQALRHPFFSEEPLEFDKDKERGRH